MAYSEDELRGLLARPTEIVGRELKPWIDPTSKKGEAIIVKACLALYNANGGCLILGFNDDGMPADNRQG